MAFSLCVYRPFLRNCHEYQNATISIRLKLFFIDTVVGFAPRGTYGINFNKEGSPVQIFLATHSLYVLPPPP